MTTVVQDFRYSMRMLSKNPGVTLIAVVALMLGIGLTTTMFSIVYGALFRGLPFEQAEHIMHLERNDLEEDIESMEVTLHDYRDWREAQSSFTDLAGFWQGTINISGNEGRPERYNGAFMAGDPFGILRVGALKGRTLQPGDDDLAAPMVAVIGYDVWQNRYDGRDDAIGSIIRVNGEPTEIVGVMPEGFAFPMSEEVWVPMRVDIDTITRGEGMTLEVYGRLNAGVSVDQAAAEFATIANRLAMEYPESNEGVGAVMKPYTEEYIGDEVSMLLFTMLAAVFLVLLIACANVANLLLARAVQRSKEVAVRSALGATRARVIGQFLTETFAVTIVGALFGLAIAWLGVRLFNNAIVDTDPPFWIDIRIDLISIAFVMTLVLIATVLAGVFPAIRASGADINEVLKDESRGSSSLRIGKMSKALVTAEIALSCGLLVAAGLMIKSVVQLRTIDYAFHVDVATARVGLFPADYPDQERRVQFFDELTGRLAAQPGVAAAALGTALPGLGSGGNRFGVEGQVYAEDSDYPLTRWAAVTPGYFETFGLAVREGGRDFTVQDTEANLPVAIVNETFAQKFFPGESPIGRRIRVGASESEEPWRTIVGVAPDMMMQGIGNNDTGEEGIYVPVAQEDQRFMSIIVRGENASMALAPVMRDVVLAIDPDLPLYWVNTLDERIAEATWFFNVFGVLFMVFGGAALFLGAVGLYGVMSFAVTQRTQEVGIRMALGANHTDVIKLIMKQGLWQLGIGLTAGLGIAALLSRGLEVVLYEVEPWDPMLFAFVAMILAVAGLAASYIPARRAARVDPVVALRYE